MAALLSHGTARGAARTTGCFVRPPSLNFNKSKLVAGGYCVVGGQKVSSVIHYGVTQEDSSRYACGQTLNGVGSTVPLKSGIYQVTSTFMVASRSKFKGKILRSRPLTSTLLIGSRVLQCGKLNQTNTPTTTKVCDYQQIYTFPDVACGSLIKSPNSGYTGGYPMWSSKPFYQNFTVYAPSFISPSGSCSRVGDPPNSEHPAFTWMGTGVFRAYWNCSDGLSIFPLLYVYYYAPGANPDGPATCSYGEQNLWLGGEYSQFQLPLDSVGWGGKLYVEWRMLVSYHHGAYISQTYADKVISFTGSNNACYDMSFHS